MKCFWLDDASFGSQQVQQLHFNFPQPINVSSVGLRPVCIIEKFLAFPSSENDHIAG